MQARLGNWRFWLSVLVVVAVTNFARKRVPMIGQVLDA